MHSSVSFSPFTNPPIGETREKVTAILLAIEDSTLTKNVVEAEAREKLAVHRAVSALAHVASRVLVVVPLRRIQAMTELCRSLVIQSRLACVPVEKGLARPDLLNRVLSAVDTPFVVIDELSGPPTSADDLERLVSAVQRLPAVALYSLDEPVDSPSMATRTPMPWRVARVHVPFATQTELLSRACLWSDRLEASEGIVGMMRRVGCRMQLIERSAQVRVEVIAASAKET